MLARLHSRAAVGDRVDEMTTYAAYFAKKAINPEVGSKHAAEFEAYVRNTYAKISDAVFEKGYDAIVTVDADGQHDPADVQRLLGRLDEQIRARTRVLPVYRATLETEGLAQALIHDPDILILDGHTPTVEDAARELAVAPEQIIKSLVFEIRGEPLLVINNGLARVDRKKLAALLGIGRKKVKFAAAELALEITGFVVGGVGLVGIGIGAVFIPTVIFLFLKGRIAASLFFLVFYLLLSGGVEYLLKPRVVGKRVQMHTLVVFLSIIGGLKIFGILGIIYGPLIATAFLTLTNIYHASYQKLIEHTQP